MQNATMKGPFEKQEQLGYIGEVPNTPPKKNLDMITLTTPKERCKMQPERTI